MPDLITSRKFLQDLDRLKSRKQIVKNVAKTLARLEADPSHPGLHIERIRNDPTAWSVRVDRRYRLSFEPDVLLASGVPDWSGKLLLLRVLPHDDLYKYPR